MALELRKNNKGQLSIFLGISLLVVISFMAFMVNIGMFVKAKINLQNAVDAAAWSGAAVQARQLTNIGYLNWEMRNTYKEWMFKYYVLGQLGLTTLKPGTLNSRDRVNFRLIPFSGDVPNNDYDKYNIPSVCIHFGASNNICKIYSVPGLPRFETDGLPSLADSTKSFMNAIVKDKARNCSTRSTFNFGAAMVWAYGMGKNLFTDVATVAAHRVGAWPQSFELALRMRNLEATMNRPPVDGPICVGDSQVPGCRPVETLPIELNNYNDRPAKAFFAAFRNLSGGKSKDNVDAESKDQLVSTFSLTELSPTPFNPDDNTLSRFLIPTGSPFTTKYYVDLQAYPINFVTFYTHFVPRGDAKDDSIKDITGTNTEAACPGTKVAIPVPGYLFGFIKNPEVLTYYAVKGSAKFVGMFYPFADRSGIELVAFAASKPFGGRVGPRLFGMAGGGQSLQARDDLQKRTAPYASYLNPPSTFTIGQPVPVSLDFWVRTPDDIIGGTPLGTSGVSFVIPNLLYSYENIDTIGDQVGNSVGRMTRINPAGTKALSRNSDEVLGLYSSEQYLALRSNLPETAPGDAAISAAQIDLAIDSVRRPTNYEALNYMIPTFEASPEDNPENLDALPIVDSTLTDQTTGTPLYYLYAPLFGDRTLYPTSETIKAIAADYINNNSSAIDTYVEALRKTALDIVQAGKNTTGQSFDSAANAIYLNPGSGDTHTNCAGPDPSMAQKFYQLFKGTALACGITPLDQLVAEFIDNQNASSRDPNHPYANYYVSTYFKPDTSNTKLKALTNSQLLTAYMPGNRQGVENGIFDHPFLNKKIKMKRNYYSTKFISLKSISSGLETSYGGKRPIYSENVGPNAPAVVEFKSPSDLTDHRLKNILEGGQLTEYDSANLAH